MLQKVFIHDLEGLSFRIKWNGVELHKLTDSFLIKLAPKLRKKNQLLCEQILQAEFERRCTGLYPEDFEEFLEGCVSSKEIETKSMVVSSKKEYRYEKPPKDRSIKSYIKKT